jgi:hypothetical protein
MRESKSSDGLVPLTLNPLNRLYCGGVYGGIVFVARSLFSCRSTPLLVRSPSPFSRPSLASPFHTMKPVFMSSLFFESGHWVLLSSGSGAPDADEDSTANASFLRRRLVFSSFKRVEGEFAAGKSRVLMENTGASLTRCRNTVLTCFTSLFSQTLQGSRFVRSLLGAMESVRRSVGHMSLTACLGSFSTDFHERVVQKETKSLFFLHLFLCARWLIAHEEEFYARQQHRITPTADSPHCRKTRTTSPLPPLHSSRRPQPLLPPPRLPTRHRSLSHLNIKEVPRRIPRVRRVAGGAERRRCGC